MQEIVCICTVCGEVLGEDNHNWFEDELYCDDCLCHKTFICSHCNERFANDSNAGDSDTPLCSRCHDSHYTRCDRCGCVLSHAFVYYTDDDEYSDIPYCYYCYDHYERISCLHSYSYKPEPIFYGDGERYMGVELEVDYGGRSECNAKVLCHLGNKEYDHIYVKTDSSLCDGLEIVTHPMSLDYHMSEMPWESLVKRAIGLGYASHKTDTCGLHIHVNRDSFSGSCSIQDECIGRVLYLVERFWQELLRFSRRSESQLKRWANRYGYKEQPVEILYTAKNGSNGRYACVNLENPDTIEFRIFRGTLKHNTLIATLQLVNLICDVAFLLSDEEVGKLGWPDFIERINPHIYPQLITYLKERRLYVNDPVSISNGEE